MGTALWPFPFCSPPAPPGATWPGTFSIQGGEETCTVLDGAFVDPDYRGYGLQRCLISEREKFA
jgi:hypothetical protein